MALECVPVRVCVRGEMRECRQNDTLAMMLLLEVAFDDAFQSQDPTHTHRLPLAPPGQGGDKDRDRLPDGGRGGLPPSCAFLVLSNPDRPTLTPTG